MTTGACAFPLFCGAYCEKRNAPIAIARMMIAVITMTVYHPERGAGSGKGEFWAYGGASAAGCSLGTSTAGDPEGAVSKDPVFSVCVIIDACTAMTVFVNWSDDPVVPSNATDSSSPPGPAGIIICTDPGSSLSAAGGLSITGAIGVVDSGDSGSSSGTTSGFSTAAAGGGYRIIRSWFFFGSNRKIKLIGKYNNFSRFRVCLVNRLAGECHLDRVRGCPLWAYTVILISREDIGANCLLACRYDIPHEFS